MNHSRWTVLVIFFMAMILFACPVSADDLAKQPVDFRLQSFWYAVTPDNGPDWSLQIQVKLLFPK